MTNFKRLLGILLVLLSVQGQSWGQLDVDIEMGRRQFIPYEAIPLSLRLTNRAGKELMLHGDGRNSWLNVMVTDQRGVSIAPFGGGNLSFQAAKVPVGRAVAKQLDLNSLFPLSSYGKYTVYTVVRLPTGESFQSSRKSFDVTKGRVLYQQRVGLGAKARDYRLISFTPSRVAYLYFQAELVDERRVVLTYPIGELLQHANPQATVDKEGDLHVLYLAAPDRYVHVLINSEGKVSKRTIYQRGASGDPRLIAFGNGEVNVAGGAEYDPKVLQEKRDKIKKMSDRPSLLFE